MVELPLFVDDLINSKEDVSPVSSCTSTGRGEKHLVTTEFPQQQK